MSSNAVPPGTARLILIRHGQSVDNVAGRISGWHESDLTPLGERQALTVARHVYEAYRPVAIYASPLRRAATTARPLADLSGLTVRTHESLRELHFGEIEGLTDLEASTRFPTHWERARNEDDELFGWPGGETRREFFERSRRAMVEIAGAHPNETVAVVSHGGVLSSVIATVVHGQPTVWRRVVVHNCSITELHANADALEVIRWNVVDHLESLDAIVG